MKRDFAAALHRGACWHLHVTPISSSWLNLVERWFKELTDRRLRRGAFTSVADIVTIPGTRQGEEQISPNRS